MAFEPDIPAIQVHLCVKDGKEAIAFYEKAFDAVETFEQMADDGVRVLHANLAMFGSEVMLHDEFPEFGGDVLSPLSRGGASMTVNINLKLPGQVDQAVERAVAAGAKTVMEPDDMFWGARYAKIQDPFGHVWAFNAPLGNASLGAQSGSDKA
ncbi:VOC family protein [Aminobacter sp. NyZ550]|jgi:PhnB protein|uniref:Glyoxalase family protein n=2 Tax=Aminobacter TaxID=31988 RepID=A0AAC8YKU0_AMIAI|nr:MULTISPECIES: VOC family protein [Aminobacter]AMS39911.1 Putative glyoxalase family protein [Aminobacter aminovorans]MBA8906321.1 PhnB protein [Aminobacter ciceronei]MBA9020100.1 PhnB protein [Aminobacter ciceronei]MBB3707199.1 PhnB protein [Aminobacter aminovorans]MRX36229.1 VOC family protein [Aminobacter sp. MDW-2]